MKEDLLNFDSRRITPKIAAATEKIISASPDSFVPAVCASVGLVFILNKNINIVP